MFLLSKRAGRLADRLGPRLFMGGGPLVAAVGLALMLRLGADVDYATDLLPALLSSRSGCRHGGAADRDGARRRRRVQRRHRLRREQRDRAHGRAARGRRARRRRLRAFANELGGNAPADAELTLGAATPAVAAASVHAFHVGIWIAAALVGAGGVLGLLGIRNPRREVRCEDCAGGQFAGQPLELARTRGPGPSGSPVTAR